MREILWAPWRMDYILRRKTSECILCIGENHERDKERLVLCRSSLSFVIMNRYPYNNGHLMVAPFHHLSAIEDLAEDTTLDMFRMLKESIGILRKCLTPEGFNIGVNMGMAGGAGIEDHLHLHIVPRWNGDTNFMPVLGDVRVMPEHLHTTYEKLFPHFDALKAVK